MLAGADAGFPAFVQREHGSLLRLARLLEDDAADADALVRASLARVRRGWRSVARSDDPAAVARTALVRRALARRPADGPRTSGWVDDFETAWAGGGSDEFRRALADLPARTRAAVVLSCWARLTDDEVAAVLREPVGTVRDEVAGGSAILRSALDPAPPPWRAVPHAPPEADDDVRRALAGLAVTGDAGAPPAVLAGTARRDVRRARHRWAAATAAGCAMLVAGAAALPGPVGERLVAGSPEQSAGQAAPDLGDLPARGSLADDRAFVDGLLRRPWESPLAGDFPGAVPTAPGTRRVLFAADVPGGRWALLTGRPQYADDRPDAPGRGDLLTAWFTGPPGAEPEDMRLSTFPYRLDRGTTPALLDPLTGTLAVVTAPGDAIEVSQRAEVAADGSTSRTWTPLDPVDGVAVTRIDPMGLPWTWSVSLRVTDAEGTSAVSPPDGIASAVSTGLPPLGVEYPGGPPTAEGRQAAEWAAFTAAATVGLAPEDAAISARLVAPAPEPAVGALAMVTLSLPSGALLVSVQWARALPDGRPGGADCGMDVRAAGPPAEERVLAAGCHLFAPAEDRQLESVLLVSAPPTVARVRVYGDDGAFLAEHDPVGGGLVVPMPPGTREVEGVTRTGVLLGRTPLLGHWTPAEE